MFAPQDVPFREFGLVKHFCEPAPSIVADAATPTSSAGDVHEIKTLDIKSPMARGDTASMLGHPDADNDHADSTDHLPPSLHTDATSGHAPPTNINTITATTTTTTALSDTADLPSPPSWVPALLTAKLFDTCPHHPGVRKNETNFFCLGCTPSGGAQGMCKHCLPTHSHCCPGHFNAIDNSTGSYQRPKMFQVRRYMYQNVVHVDDINQLYDVSGVQAYCINGKRAVLISPKPPAAGLNGPPVFANRCHGCEIPLRPDCSFCSLACKVESDYGSEHSGLPPKTPHGGGCGGRGSGTLTTPAVGVHGRGAGMYTNSITQQNYLSPTKHLRYGHGGVMGERSSYILFSSRPSPSDASTATRIGVKRRKLDSPQRAHVF